MVNLKMFLVNFKENELLNINDLGLNEKEIGKYRNVVNEFWGREVEDREVELKDLKNGEGFLYNLLVEWCENEVVKELDMGFDAWEYSIEDYFRDEYKDVFKMEDINEMLYYRVEVKF